MASWETHFLGEGGAKDLGGPGCSHGQSLSHRATAPEELWGTQSQTETSGLSCALLYLVRIDSRPGLLSPAKQFPETVVSDVTERQAVTDPASRLPI